MASFVALVECIKQYNEANSIVLKGKTIPSIGIDESITEEDVLSAQERIGFSLCDSYKDYLKTLGHISCSTGHLLGMSRPENGELEYWFVDETKRVRELIDEPFPSKNFTVFQVENEDEWFTFIDHANSKIFNYDPFAKDFILTDRTVFDEVENIVSMAIGD